MPQPAPVSAPPLPLGHPALLGAAVVAAACVAFTVTFRLTDSDLWQHLLVGRVIWQTHAIPMRQIWCWPTWGEPQVLPSWGFRALLWPFWTLGGTLGLFLWRWLTTLLAFGLAWAAARRMGARGLTPLVVVALGALLYRQRSQVRPETLVVVLLALEILILETRRNGGPDRSWWLPMMACAWANVHISYYLGLTVLGIHVLDEALRRGRPGRLGLVLAACCAASLVNPFGAGVLAQPFEYFLFWRHEPIFGGISELRPVQWEHNLRNGLPLLLAAWPLLLFWRARRFGFDLAEALTLLAFAGFGLTSQRFLGFLALAATPYLARDLDAWIALRRWPRWTAAPATRATLAAVACVALGVPEWTDTQFAPGIGFEWNRYPVVACDFVAAHEIAGRCYNPFHFGGYLLWRFWPDPARLPFMDIHQTGAREDRRLAAEVYTRREAYHELMARHRFDWAVLDRRTEAGSLVLDDFDHDSTWSLVFADDAAALFVRREPRFATLIERHGYRAWPAGWASLNEVGRRWRADSSFRALARADLERQAASSPYHSMAENFLANLDLLEHRDAEAARHLEAALAVDPRLPTGHERLAGIALRAGREGEARREYRLELRGHPENRAARAALARLGPG